jgi:hypothetical protein
VASARVRRVWSRRTLTTRSAARASSIGCAVPSRARAAAQTGHLPACLDPLAARRYRRDALARRSHPSSGSRAVPTPRPAGNGAASPRPRRRHLPRRRSAASLPVQRTRRECPMGQPRVARRSAALRPRERAAKGT